MDSQFLANRLKRVVSNVVNLAHTAFVEGRQILDPSLMANEIVDTLIRRRDTEVLCMLEIEKAYDNVSWSFLIQTMCETRFGEKCLGWIARRFLVPTFL